MKDCMPIEKKEEKDLRKNGYAKLWGPSRPFD